MYIDCSPLFAFDKLIIRYFHKLFCQTVNRDFGILSGIFDMTMKRALQNAHKKAAAFATALNVIIFWNFSRNQES